MILPRTDSVSRPIDSLNQKPPAFSRLTKQELAEVHDASTHYPPQKESAPHVDHFSNMASRNAEQSSAKAVETASPGHVRKDMDCAETQPGAGPLSDNDEEPLETLDPLQNSLAISSPDEYQKQDNLHFYHEKEALVKNDVDDENSVSDETHRAHLPPASSLVGGVPGLIGQLKSFFQPHQPSLSVDDSSLTSIAGMTNSVSDKIQSVSTRKSEMNLMERSDLMIKDLDLQLDEPKEEVKIPDEKVERGESRNLESRDKVATPRDTGDDASFSGTQQERPHEVANKMGEKENEENNFIAPKTVMTHAEVAPTTGSSASTEARQSDAIAAALRVTHLLDELTATVGRLRLESSDGKEMTIQLRPDVLADTNIHIIATGKQMEVSFLTNNQASHLLLNTHLATLQNHLNALCPGQVVNVQTQLTPSSGSAHTGSEQDRSHDDLASFDQGNRGNFSNDDDNL